MTPNLSKIADSILSERKKKPGVEVSEVEIAKPDLAEVLGEFSTALDKGDLKAAARSFRAAQSLCQDEGYDEPEGEEGDEE